MSDYPDVCLITNPIGATGNAVHELLDILTEITTVALVTANLPESSPIWGEYEVAEIDHNREVDSIVPAAFYFLLNQVRMCNEIRKRDENVMWFFGATAYLLPILFAKFLGKTVVIQPRGDIPLTLQLHWEQHVPDVLAYFLAGIVGTLEGVGYRLADAIVTYTPAMATELGLNRYKRKLHPDGARYVDTEKFYPHIPYDERDRVVGFLGRLDEEKGVRELTEVAKRLPEDVTFVFAGDGDLRGWLETELADEIESGSVELLGWVGRKEVPEVLSRFRLLVLPSQPTEGLPTVILEAFACGTPVYATPVSGVPDVVQEGETGFLLEEVDDEIIAIKIEEMLQQEDLEEISLNSREQVETEYSIEAAAERYRDIFNEL